MTPDEVLAELLTIRSELESAEPGSTLHNELTERRLLLAEAAQEAAYVARHPDLVRAELEHLQKRLAEFDGTKINVPAWRAATPSITDPAAQVSQINRKLDDNHKLDRAAIEQRIARLRKALTQ